MSLPNRQLAADDAIHLMASIRAEAEKVSAAEGVTLNEFINVAVAEKLAHQMHIDWVKHRTSIDPDHVQKALHLLDRTDNIPPMPGDEMPEGSPVR